MAQWFPITPSIINGQRGWLLRWTEPDPRPPSNAPVKLSHWFADVDEAMAVQLAMRGGATFEDARKVLLESVGCV